MKKVFQPEARHVRLRTKIKKDDTKYNRTKSKQNEKRYENHEE